MVDQARARRLAKRISQIVAEALEHEVKDPRLTMVTITDTRVTGDLREATVYYTVLGETVDAEPGHRRRGRRAGQRHRRAALDGRGGHRDPAHPVAGVRAPTWCPTRPGGWRSCWPAPASPTPRWRGSPPAPAGGRPRSVPRPARGRGGRGLNGGRAGEMPALRRYRVPWMIRARATAASGLAPHRRRSGRGPSCDLSRHRRPRAAALLPAAATSAAGARPARRGHARQRARAGHRRCTGAAPAVASFGAPGLVPGRCGRSTCTGSSCPRRTRPAPELLVTCDAAEPRRLGRSPAGWTRPAPDHDRPPRPLVRACGSIDLVDARGHRGARPPCWTRWARRSTPSRRRCLYAGLFTDTRGFRAAGAAAAARRRADRGGRGPAVAAPGAGPPTRSPGWPPGQDPGRCPPRPRARGPGLVWAQVDAATARFRDQVVDVVAPPVRDGGPGVAALMSRWPTVVAALAALARPARRGRGRAALGGGGHRGRRDTLPGHRGARAGRAARGARGVRRSRRGPEPSPRTRSRPAATDERSSEDVDGGDP